MSKKKKIVVPSPEEVARYTGGAKPQDPPTSEEAPAANEPSSETNPSESATPIAEEAEQWKAKFLRAKADLANYQRRTEKERSDSIRYANAALVQALLPVLDDLERVIASASEAPADARSVAEGAKLTLDKFLKVLSGFNVSPIEAVGAPFDPVLHEAIMQQPSAEHAEPTVLEEVARGYRLHDRVLRPSRVIVSKPIEAAAENEGGDEGADGSS